MAALATTFDYLRAYGQSLGNRIVELYKPMHSPGDPLSPLLSKLKRKLLPAQAITVMGTANFLKTKSAVKIVAECGCGKTIMSIAACYVHANGKRFTALTMCPPHLPLKWCREILITVPNARVFLIENMKNAADPKKPHGIVEVIYTNGDVKRKGLKLTLSDLRLMGPKGFAKMVPETTFFVMSKERGKLSYFWRHAFNVAKSGPNQGRVIAIDTGLPIETDEGGYIGRESFDNIKLNVEAERTHGGTTVHSALWQADKTKIQRMAPLEYMGRYMHHFFDYAIADELHQLGGDTAQGNGLAVLNRVAKKLIGLTGTMMGGYADDLYNILYRMDAPQMATNGYEWGGGGRAAFQSTYGVCEEVVKRQIEDNACSNGSKPSVTIKRRPGASPLLMETTAFVSLEDIAANLPSYNESVISVPLEGELLTAYTSVEEDIKDALKTYPRNSSIMSMMMNTLLCYPDHPFAFRALYAKVRDKQTGKIEHVHISDPPELDRNVLYPKESALLADVQAEIAEGRRVQVYATYTGEHDVTARLKWVFEQAGLRVAVLKSSVPTESREAWYKTRLSEGVQVVICHPKLVETGLDLLSFPTLYFYETGFSLYTLRQSSRRSWRIGQSQPVRVKFMMYAGTAQESQMRLMGKKLLVAMMMEGKFSGEGLDGFEEDDDMVSSMVRELLEDGKVGESADAVWASLERERAVQMIAGPSEEVTNLIEQLSDDCELDSVAETLEVPSLVFLPEEPVARPVVQANILAFNSITRRKPVSRHHDPAYENQLRLFA
jgi:hypothetical protein